MIVGTAIVGVTVSRILEGFFVGDGDSDPGEAVGLAIGTVIAARVKEVSEGAGEGGGEDNTD
jgi:hypothetical protein